MIAFEDIKLELYFGSSWTDVYRDVVGNVRVSYGIKGGGPLDRIASIGTMKFMLYSTSGEYIPGHSGASAYFTEGMLAKISFTYTPVSVQIEHVKFYGRIQSINPIPADGLGYYTEVTVVDYMNELAVHEMNLPTFVENKTLTEILPLILANIPVSPVNYFNNSSTSIFPGVFDTTLSKTRAMSELAKAVNSELGYAYCTPQFVVEFGSSTIIENMVVEGRYTAPLLLYQSEVTLTDEDISDIEFEFGKHYYNDIKTTVYPREIDAAATSVLYSLEYVIQIGPGETLTIKGQYKDPNQNAVQVTGIDMVTPAATTDYTFNAQQSGGGSDITADLDVTATYGTNGVEYELTNNNAATGYVTKLQARGKGVYIYRPVEYDAEYAAGIAADGRKTLSLTMPYESNPLVGKDFADALIEVYKTKVLNVLSITAEVNKNAKLMAYFIGIGLRRRVTLDLDDLEVDEDYYINGIEFDLTNTGNLFLKLYLSPLRYSTSSNVWVLGYTGKTELDSTTILAF